MSKKLKSINQHNEKSHAFIFAALSDETRLSLIAVLSDGVARSIAELSVNTPLKRQTITKHLRVLESAGIVHSVKIGRENLFEFNPVPFVTLQKYLKIVSTQWDRAPLRLKSFVEHPKSL